MEEKQAQYYAVLYAVDGTIHLWPGNSQEECLERLRGILKNEVKNDYCKATTVIKRDMSNFKDGMIFGNPKSLDVKNTSIKPKKNTQ